MTADQYTRPEKSTEVKICRRIRSKILNDPCRYCLRRDPKGDEVGIAVCKTWGRTWWECRNSKIEPTFALDENTL